MKRGKVICSTTKGPVEVPALLGSYFAVHHSLVSGEYQADASDDWTVTHIASGLAAEWCDTQTEGRAFIEQIERERADDLAVLSAVKFGENPSERGKIGRANKRLYQTRNEYRARAA